MPDLGAIALSLGAVTQGSAEVAVECNGDDEDAAKEEGKSRSATCGLLDSPPALGVTGAPAAALAGGRSPPGSAR